MKKFILFMTFLLSVFAAPVYPAPEGLDPCVFAKDFAEAKQKCGEIIKGYPGMSSREKVADAYYRLSSAALLEKKNKEAVKHYTQYIEFLTDRWPDVDLEYVVMARKNRGQSYLGDGDYDKAIEDFNYALSFYKSEGYSRSEVIAYRGLAYYKKGEHAKAKRDLEAANYISSKRPEFQEAVSFYESGGKKVAKRRPAQMATTEDMKMCAKTLDFNKARKHCSIVLNTYPYKPVTKQEAANAAYSLGLLNMETGQYQEAVENFAQALEFFPRKAWYQSARGRAKAELGKFEQAFADFHYVIHGYTQAPMRAYGYGQRGLVLKKLGHHDQAKQDIRYAYSWGYDDKEVVEAFKEYGLKWNRILPSRLTLDPKTLASASQPSPKSGRSLSRELASSSTSGRSKKVFNEPPSKLFPPDHISNYQPTNPDFSLGDDLNF